MTKEKTGNTVKLIYDFITTDSCEVMISSGRWCRVTPREFRSWGGLRRTVRGTEINTYDGPVYYYNTNEIAKSWTTKHIVEKEGKEQVKNKKATHEDFNGY